MCREFFIEQLLEERIIIMKKSKRITSLLMSVILLISIISSQGFEQTTASAKKKEVTAQTVKEQTKTEQKAHLLGLEMSGTELSNAKELDISKGSITISSTGYIASGASVEVAYTGDYVITGTSTDDNYIIINGQAAGSKIKFNGLNIETDHISPLTIGNNTMANIIIGPKGVNFSSIGTCKFTIHINLGSALSMTGTGNIALYSENGLAIFSTYSAISIETMGNIIINGVQGVLSDDLSLISSNGKIDIETENYAIDANNIIIRAKELINIKSNNGVCCNSSEGNVSIISEEASVSIKTESNISNAIFYKNSLVIHANSDVFVNGNDYCIVANDFTNVNISADVSTVVGSIHITTSNSNLQAVYTNHITLSAPVGGAFLSNAAAPDKTPIVTGTLLVGEGTTCHLSGGIDNMIYAKDGTIDRVRATLGTSLDFTSSTTNANGIGYSWDKDKNTLTLKNLDLQVTSGSDILLPKDATVILTGSNQITTTADSCNGIEGSGTLTLLGEGTLSITVHNKTGNGIQSEAVVISGGTLNISGCTGIYASNGKITVLDGAFSIHIQDGGFYSEKGIQISAGTIEISDGFSGFFSKGDVLISGGSVNIHDTNSGIYLANGDFTMSGGSLDINSKGIGLATNYEFATGKGKISFLSGSSSVIADIAIIIAMSNDTNTVKIPQNIEINTENLTVLGGVLTDTEWIKTPKLDSYYYIAYNIFSLKDDGVVNVDVSNGKIEGAAKKIVIQPKSTFSISFISNGGTKIADQAVGKGTTITKPSQPEQSGYTFCGWYRDAEFATPWDFDKDTVTKDTILYAKWKQNESVAIGTIPDTTLTPITKTTENQDGTTTMTTTTTTAKSNGNTVVKKAEVNKDKNQQIINQSQTITVKAKDGSTVTVVIKENANGTVTSVNGSVDAGVASADVIKNTAEINVTLPETIINTAASEIENETGEQINLSADLPVSEVIKQLTDDTVKEIEIRLTLPESITKNDKISLFSIELPKEILNAAKKQGKTVNVNIENADKTKTTWSFDKTTLEKTSRSIQDTNLLVDTATTESLLKSTKSSIKGIVLDFKQDGLLPGAAKVKVYVADNHEKTDIKAGSKVYLYDYEEKKGTFLELPTTQYQVDEEGYITIDVTHGSQYVLFPAKLNDNVSSLLNQISVNKKITMAIKGSDSTKRVRVSVADIFVTVKKFSREANVGVAEIIFTYKSSNKKIVTVSSTGILKAKAAGTATITVTAKLADGTTKTYKEKVTVE